MVLPEAVTGGMQIQALSGSMPPVFSQFWQYTLPAGSSPGSWTLLDPTNPNEGTWRSQPVVLEKPDPSDPYNSSKGLAIGLYTPEILNPPSGTTGYFTWNSYVAGGDSASFWSFLYRTPPSFVAQGTIIFHDVYLVLGTRDEVQDGLNRLHCYFFNVCQ
jgi:hypothetical protein